MLISERAAEKKLSSVSIEGLGYEFWCNSTLPAWLTVAEKPPSTLNSLCYIYMWWGELIVAVILCLEALRWPKSGVYCSYRDRPKSSETRFLEPLLIRVPPKNKQRPSNHGIRMHSGWSIVKGNAYFPTSAEKKNRPKTSGVLWYGELVDSTVN